MIENGQTDTDHPKGDKEQQYYDDLLGRGRGDPDVYGYPEPGTVPDYGSEWNLLEPDEWPDVD